ncbi:helix-turn-helix domain-containing protein [Bacillus sp. FSL K6-3431]|uniref:helix-turn-helix domain-containing protein n=1 Tax=Bacillus sp. FSL K6-3431 TaxID=2921500 RepID=UPI0030F6322F
MTKSLKMPINNPVEFISGGQFISEKPWIHTKRNINSFEIIIGANKTLYIEQDGIDYEVNPGDVLVILPHMEHKGFDTSDKELSFYWFHFYCPANYEIINQEIMKDEVNNVRVNAKDSQSDNYIYLPIFFTPSSIDRVNIMFRQLLHVYQSNYFTPYSGHYLTTSILIELTEQAISHLYLPTSSTEEDNNLHSLLEWTRIHALENISVTSIAKRFNYSREYLSRHFKKNTGMTLIEYIHFIRISKAKDYLARTNESIKEIAYQVGFQDEKYFMKLFKKYERMTPTEYRSSFFRIKMNNN